MTSLSSWKTYKRFFTHGFHLPCENQPKNSMRAKRKLRHIKRNTVSTVSVHRQDHSNAKCENADLFLTFWVRKNQNMRRESQNSNSSWMSVCLAPSFPPLADAKIQRTLICLCAFQWNRMVTNGWTKYWNWSDKKRGKHFLPQNKTNQRRKKNNLQTIVFEPLVTELERPTRCQRSICSIRIDQRASR